MKITLDSIISGFKSVTKLIANFDSIESELNDKVLYRDNPEGEPNQMNTELDMNSKSLKNLPSPTNDNDAARWVDVKNGVTTLDATLPTLSGNTDRALSTDGAALVFKDGDDLSFTNTAAGASRRTLGAKISELVSVEDFGAVGNGTTDDITAINAALATGRHVVFKAGADYRVSALPLFSGASISANGATLSLDDGKYTNVPAISFEYIAGQLNIATSNGATAATSNEISASSGSTGAYSVTLLSADTSGVVVGDYVRISKNSTNRYLAGYHEITNIVGNTSITLLITAKASTNPFTPAVFGSAINLHLPAVQLNFATSTANAIDINNGSLSLGPMGLVGDTNTIGIEVAERSTLRNSGDLQLSGFIVAVRVINGSMCFEADQWHVSNCSQTAIQVLDGSFMDATTLNVSASSGGAFSTQNSSVSITTLNISGCGTGASLKSGFTRITTLDAIAQLPNFNIGFYGQEISNSTVSTGTIEGYYQGVTAIDNAQIHTGSTTVKNCTTGVTATRHSEVSVRTGTLTGNTVNYDISGGATLTNTAGGVEPSNVEHITLTDGASVPTTAAGKTFLYVDSADGDLKVKFGDGTVKTISVDT